MSTPTATRVVEALRKHPELFAEVIRIIEELEWSGHAIPVYEYEQVTAMPTVQRMANDGWRCVGAANGGSMGVVYVMERRRR